jgi:hypothetical protein
MSWRASRRRKDRHQAPGCLAMDLNVISPAARAWAMVLVADLSIRVGEQCIP